MNCQNERAAIPKIDLPPSLLPVVPAAAQESAPSTGSDRLYQIAALTAGAIFLATLL
jgi:hypothetical protein